MYYEKQKYTMQKPEQESSQGQKMLYIPKENEVPKGFLGWYLCLQQLKKTKKKSAAVLDAIDTLLADNDLPKAVQSFTRRTRYNVSKTWH